MAFVKKEKKKKLSRFTNTRNSSDKQRVIDDVAIDRDKERG